MANAISSARPPSAPETLQLALLPLLLLQPPVSRLHPPVGAPAVVEPPQPLAPELHPLEEQPLDPIAQPDELPQPLELDEPPHPPQPPPQPAYSYSTGPTQT